MRRVLEFGHSPQAPPHLPTARKGQIPPPSSPHSPRKYQKTQDRPISPGDIERDQHPIGEKSAGKKFRRQ